MARIEKRPLKPCSCSSCRHCWALGQVCTARLIARAPGEKKLGCLYFEDRREGR